MRFSLVVSRYVFFFFNDTATTEIYTLSLHDALPISSAAAGRAGASWRRPRPCCPRSEEHTSELQSRGHLVCRLLLEKKKKDLAQLIFKTKNKHQYKYKTHTTNI